MGRHNQLMTSRHGTSDEQEPDVYVAGEVIPTIPPEIVVQSVKRCTTLHFATALQKKQAWSLWSHATPWGKKKKQEINSTRFVLNYMPFWLFYVYIKEYNIPPTFTN